ncbi:hypothetical protein D3C87_349590 [compost metagenome]
MEESVTKRKANTINITVYGDNLNSKELTGQLNTFIDPDGNNVHGFVFRTVSINIALNENDKSTNLFIVVADETNTNIEKLIGTLKKNERTYIIIDTSENFIELCKAALSSLEKALEMDFTITDFAHIWNKGISMEKIRQQLLIFKNGITRTVLKKPAVLNDGVFPLSQDIALEYSAYFDARKDNFDLTKFVPSSGAASRMFKFLIEFIAEFDPSKETINAYINRKKESELNVFLVGLDKFPFYMEVSRVMTQNNPGWKKEQRAYYFIKTLLDNKSFNFANKPKGILPFHKYGDFTATPVYEHLKESVAYACSKKQAYVHFTISEDHLDGFLDSINEVKPGIEAESCTTINVSFSYQQKYTDTLAVTVNNTPFREDSDQLLFRPGGHGALIENLGKLDVDIAFIKNIDNVSHNNIKTIALYKKALAGILIKLQEQLFSYLNKIEQNDITENDIDAVFVFAKEKLSQHIPADISKYTLANKTEYAAQLLNRPIRVCGMVKNEGEPGGGPFWILEKNGNLSLQIVESSQIDLENKAQQQIFSNSTHFNPVDLVCGLKNYKGEFFNLSNFIDPSSGFITYKNRFGKEVKSYELPGLWNGAMAGWITVFVEVPLETFSPVKTVNDLLKPTHQPQ